MASHNGLVSHRKRCALFRIMSAAPSDQKTMTPRTALIALAAKRLNRPVKLVASRAQGFTIATYRAETRHHIRLGARSDGKLVGYSHGRLGDQFSP